MINRNDLIKQFLFKIHGVLTDYSRSLFRRPQTFVTIKQDYDELRTIAPSCTY